MLIQMNNINPKKYNIWKKHLNTVPSISKLSQFRLQEQIREYFRLDIKNGGKAILIFLNSSGCSYVLSTTTWIFRITANRLL